MDKIFGLPAHPLLVHIPIVLLPLSSLGVLAMLLKPVWHQRFRWVVLAIGAAGAGGATLAAQAGEELERRIVAVEGIDAARSWQHHADLGETARTVALAYLVLLLAFVLVPWWQERNTRTTVLDSLPTPPSRTARLVRLGVSALVVVGAAGTVVTVVQAGHSGSRSVWEDYVRDSKGAAEHAPAGAAS